MGGRPVVEQGLDRLTLGVGDGGLSLTDIEPLLRGQCGKPCSKARASRAVKATQKARSPRRQGQHRPDRVGAVVLEHGPTPGESSATSCSTRPSRSQAAQRSAWRRFRPH